MMTLKEFQAQAELTAVYPGQGGEMGLTYVTLGIISEAGEIAGVLKKAIRQDDDLDQTERFISEAGDALWYVAGYYTETGVEMPDIDLTVFQTEAHKDTNYGDGLTRCVYALGAAAGLVLGAFLDGEDTEPFVALYLQLVAALGVELGVTLEDIAIANRDKLARRAEVGTLKGSGDDR